MKCSVLSKISSPHIGVKGLFLTPVRLYVTQRLSSLTPRLKMIGGKGEHEHDSGVGDGGGEGGRGGKREGLSCRGFSSQFLPDSVIVDCSTSFASKQSR